MPESSHYRRYRNDKIGESYFEDGIALLDVEYVEELGKVVRKENLLIKIHPRNPENRFEKRGVMTNRDIAIPWKLIAVKKKLENTTLITIASASGVASYFLTNEKAKKVYCCINIKKWIKLI